MAKNQVITEKEMDRYPLDKMVKGREGFKPLRHKKTKEPWSDLDYLLGLGEKISLGQEEWKREHPHREYQMEGVNPEVIKFAQIIYKGYQDGISRRELAEYIRDSIDIDH